ncbi:MAG: M20/M25/M40 family metallo-hydrolase [Candidatus Acidiferrum sp.]
MRLVSFLFGSLLLALVASPLSAQLASGQSDPLARQSAAAQTCSATEASCAEAAAKIIPQVMGPSPMEENLRRLTDEIGGRVSGTRELAKAVDWAVAAFRAAGITVHTEKYQLAHSWSEGNTTLELLGPETFPVRLVSAGWSPATAPGGVEANLIYVAEGAAEDFQKAGASVKGSVLLVSSKVIGSSWADLFDEYALPPAIIDRAVKGGAAAILWTGARERLLMYRHTNAFDGQIDVIPQAVVAREDALHLARTVIAYPGKVRVRFNMPNKIGGPIDQFNVIGEIRGREKPDEAVILGAHLDSWELGTGALDNGCNAALVIESARAIRATGLVPRRSIRFALFTGEEQGMVGSWQYVQVHRAEMDKIRGVIVFDDGSGRTTGFSVTGRADIRDGLTEILKPLASWDVNNHVLSGDIGTDNWDFVLDGVPTMVGNQVEANYLPNYHAASDTFDKVDIRELKINTVIAAVTAWGVADREQPLGKRYTRAEIEQQLKDTGLDEQMKREGLWEGWQTGAHGRKD